MDATEKQVNQPVSKFRARDFLLKIEGFDSVINSQVSTKKQKAEQLKLFDDLKMVEESEQDIDIADLDDALLDISYS